MLQCVAVYIRWPIHEMGPLIRLCVAVCCSVLQCVTVYIRGLIQRVCECVAVSFSVLQRVSMSGSIHHRAYSNKMGPLSRIG